MCMTTEFFALFLNILGADMVSMAPERITVHATEADAVWVARDDKWCTMAPQIDRMARFETRPAEAVE